jgi:hypothetical protein
MANSGEGVDMVTGRLVRSKVAAVAASIGLIVLTVGVAVTTSVVAPTAAGATAVPWTPSEAPLPTAPLPDGSTATGMQLFATSCVSADYCVSVGWVSEGTEANGWSGKFPLAETYANGEWTPSVLPEPSDASSNFYTAVLYSVSCASAGSCAAVGDYYSFDAANDTANQSGLLEILAGGTWTDSAAPLPNGPNSGLVNLNSVSCSDPTTCVGIGTYTPDAGGPNVGLIYQLQNGSWAPQTVPVPGGSNEEDLSAVACPDDGACTAVGDWLDQNFIFHPLVMTLSSGTWGLVSVPGPADQNATGGQLILRAVDCPEVTTCVAGGSYYDTNNFGQPLFLEEQGGVWTAQKAPVPSDAPADPNAAIFGVYCPAAGSCTATGAYEPGGTGSNPAGMILTLAGGSWSAQTAPLPANFTAGPNSAAAHDLGPHAAPALEAAPSSTPASLAGVGCGVDGFCASSGEVGSGGGLLETGGFSGVPAVSGLSPAEGPLAGGTTVTITGSNFGSDSVASFGGKAASTTVVSATELVATAPAASAAGVVNVTVSTGGTQTRAATANEFAYQGAQSRVGGYALAATAAATQSAAVTFYVPAAQCFGNPKTANQVVDEGARIRTTSGDTFGAVAIGCVATRAVYSVVAAVNGVPDAPTVPITPGKKVTVSITESAATSNVTITTPSGQQVDTGTGATVTELDLGALAANCNPSACAPVPRMGTTSFIAASLDGQTPTAAAAPLVNLKDAAGAIEVLAAKTGGTTSATFKTTWKLSCSKSAPC